MLASGPASGPFYTSLTFWTGAGVVAVLLGVVVAIVLWRLGPPKPVLVYSMPALSSSLVSPVLEQLQDLSVGDRALLAEGCPGLPECLERVPDPRDPRGVRHTLTSLLLAAVAAVLAGAQSLAAVGEWVADAPPQVLAAPGIRHDPLTGQFQPPSEATIRRVLESADAAEFDAAVGSWLARRLTAGTAHVVHGPCCPVTQKCQVAVPLRRSGCWSG